MPQIQLELDDPGNGILFQVLHYTTFMYINQHFAICSPYSDCPCKDKNIFESIPTKDIDIYIQDLLTSIHIFVSKWAYENLSFVRPLPQESTDPLRFIALIMAQNLGMRHSS